MYLIVPLLRIWVKDENKKYVEYFIILSVIFTYLIPQIINIGSNFSNLFITFNEIIETKLQLKYVGGFAAYFILGWYIHNYDFKNNKTIYALGILGLFISLFGTYLLSVITGTIILLYANLNINVLFQSVAVFTIVKTKFINKQKNTFINSISKYSLGIYAIHALIVTILYIVIDKFNSNFAPITILLVFTISFTTSYIISLILSKIPILKEIV